MNRELPTGEPSGRLVAITRMRKYVLAMLGLQLPLRCFGTHCDADSLRGTEVERSFFERVIV